MPAAPLFTAHTFVSPKTVIDRSATRRTFGEHRETVAGAAGGKKRIAIDAVGDLIGGVKVNLFGQRGVSLVWIRFGGGRLARRQRPFHRSFRRPGGQCLGGGGETIHLHCDLSITGRQPEFVTTVISGGGRSLPRAAFSGFGALEN